MMDNKDEEVIVSEEKKGTNKSNVLIVIIVILCMIIAGLGGFILHDFLDKNNSNISEKNGVDDKKDDNSENDVASKVAVTDLDSINDKFEKFMRAMGECGDVAANYFTTKKVVASDISNELAYKTIAYALYDQKVAISADDFSKKVLEYFGNDYTYQHFTYNGCVSHVYNSTTNAYEHVETACGCTTGPNAFISYKISEAYYENDLLVLNVKVLFPSKEYKEGEYHKYYSDAARTKEIVDLVYSEVVDGWLLGAHPLSTDENFAKGGNYKFVMKKVNNDVYSFISSEPVL